MAINFYFATFASVARRAAFSQVYESRRMVNNVCVLFKKDQIAACVYSIRGKFNKTKKKKQTSTVSYYIYFAKMKHRCQDCREKKNRRSWHSVFACNPPLFTIFVEILISMYPFFARFVVVTRIRDYVTRNRRLSQVTVTGGWNPPLAYDVANNELLLPNIVRTYIYIYGAQ